MHWTINIHMCTVQRFCTNLGIRTPNNTLFLNLLKFTSGRFAGFMIGVMSHVLIMYPLSPSRIPSSGGWFPSKAVNKGLFRNTLVSWTDPCHLATTLMYLHHRWPSKQCIEIQVINIPVNCTYNCTK
jgi:hypothetical protein